MTDSVTDPGVTQAPPAEGPDPAIGAGITLLGIFLMGTAGARDAHYMFDVGVLTGVVGAGVFVLFVALSAMRMRSADAALERSTERAALEAEQRNEPSMPPSGAHP